MSSLNFELPFPVQVSTNLPIDAWSYHPDGRPYATPQEAIESVPIGVRYKGMQVIVVDADDPDYVQTYIWSKSTADEDLEIYVTGSVLDENGNITGSIIPANMTHESRIKFVPQRGELIYDIDESRLYVGDGYTLGGIRSDLVQPIDSLDQDNPDVPLSARQGKALKDQIDGIANGLQYFTAFVEGAENPGTVTFVQFGWNSIPTIYKEDSNIHGHVSIGSEITILGGDGAFRNNNITSVYLPRTIIDLGNSAFSYNDISHVDLSHLTELEDLGTSCFAHNAITSVVLSKSDKLTSLGYYSFAFNKISGEVIIPENITTLGSGAFAYNNIALVVLEEGVVELGLDCFKENKNLTSVQLPSTLLDLGTRSFAYCGITSLKDIKIPTSVQNMGDSFLIGNVFMNLEGFPEHITQFSSHTFEDNNVIEEVYIPNHVTGLGSNCFYGCDNLKTVHLHGNITSWGSGAFAYCKITTYNVSGSPGGLDYRLGGNEATVPSNTITFNISGDYSDRWTTYVNTYFPGATINIV